MLAVSNVLENKTGCRFLTVDAYAAAVPFYEKNGFIPLNNEDVDSATRLLYFDLNDIVKYIRAALLNILFCIRNKMVYPLFYIRNKKLIETCFFIYIRFNYTIIIYFLS